MSASKHFEKIAWGFTAIILVITILFMNSGFFGIEAMPRTMGYENRLFDNTRVHTIDIVMNNWDEFVDNATSEEYYTTSLVIDGVAFKNVAIRGKGNTSLSSVSSMNSDRYSFKVEFDHYDNSMSYYGLDKLSLNNLIQDSTMMKDYLTYTMMREFDAVSPLCSFVYITVNGKDWGLYLAVEGVEDSFLERNFGTNYGELYKPDSMGFGGGRGNGKDFNMDNFINNRESTENTNQNNTSQNKVNFGMGGFGMGSSDVKLQYINDNISSYSNIWNNAKTDITEEDQTRLIESLKKLSAKEQIESVVDIEKVIRYFVVHNFVCNGDSYTGSMVHNYYLYEENGKLSMIPWDYNLAYGTFQGGNGQSTINTPIDAPVSGGAGTDRPMWNWILSNDTYTEMYHQYYSDFLNSVDIQALIDNAYNLISPYVKKDPTAFYSYDEFIKGIETLRMFCSLRSESVSMQLENGETTNNMNYADASALALSEMGSMGGKGGFGGGMPGNNRGNVNVREASRNTTSDVINTDISKSSAETFATSRFAPGQSNRTPTTSETFDPSQMQGGFNGKAPSVQNIPENFGGFQIPSETTADVSNDSNPVQSSGSFGGGMFPGQSPSRTEGNIPNNSQGANLSENSNRNPSRNNMSMPGSSFGPNMNGTSNASRVDPNILLLATSVLCLCIGLIIAKLYKH